MEIYELNHVFYCDNSGVIISPKALGIYASHKSAQDAILYYMNQPGFSANPDAFVIHRRIVNGVVRDNMIFEALVYFHSIDYEDEYEIEIGLFSDEKSAMTAMSIFCEDNPGLLHTKKIVVERIVNRCIIDHNEWPLGFSVE